MTSRRQQLLTRMLKSVSGETEEKLLKLTVERIIADQADYYRKLYESEGPGVVVFMPQKDEKDSMFYLTVDRLINAVNDANSRDLHGAELINELKKINDSIIFSGLGGIKHQLYISHT